MGNLRSYEWQTSEWPNYLILRTQTKICSSALVLFLPFFIVNFKYLSDVSEATPLVPSLPFLCDFRTFYTQHCSFHGRVLAILIFFVFLIFRNDLRFFPVQPVQKLPSVYNFLRDFGTFNTQLWDTATPVLFHVENSTGAIEKIEKTVNV